MNYGIYKNVRNSAWQCLIDAAVSELPVSVVKLADHYDVAVVKNRGRNWLSPGQSGVSIRTEDGTWIICYDERESIERIRFTICHELGHILLGHPLKPGLLQHTRTIDKERPEIESEADMFAARILAPACVLWGLECYEPEDIMRVCDISKEAAQYRSERMKVLRDRGKFLASPLERQVFEAFKPWIEQQKSRPG